MGLTFGSVCFQGLYFKGVITNRSSINMCICKGNLNLCIYLRSGGKVKRGNERSLSFTYPHSFFLSLLSVIPSEYK